MTSGKDIMPPKRDAAAAGLPMHVRDNPQQKARVLVVFSSKLFGQDTQIVIPVKTTNTVSDLLAEALRRAESLGLEIPNGNLVLHIESENGAVAFHEDQLGDIIDVKEKDNTFWVGRTRVSRGKSDVIYVRWVTAGRALEFPTLAAIPSDNEAIPRITTITGLKRIATERIYRSSGGTEPSTLPDFQLELFLDSCPLSTTEEMNTTLDYLGCSGTFDKPLNVYMVPKSTASADEEKPYCLWGFETSNRGIACFLTCLKVLMTEIHNKPTVARRLLKIAFNFTHFPPLLHALQVLSSANRLIPSAVLVLATCFRELALRMVPGCFINNSVASTLEGSRQIFAWLYSECSAVSDEIDDPETALVRSVVFQEVKLEEESEADAMVDPGKRCEQVDIFAESEAMADSAPSATSIRGVRKVRVLAHIGCEADLRQLAIASWGKYEHITNYYVDFTFNIADPLNHKRKPLVDVNDFDTLLNDANTSPRFLMLCPLELNDRHAQGITLSLKSSVENAISGVYNLTGDNPGQVLYDALQPVIRQRKAEGTWDIDHWIIRNLPEEQEPIPDEAVVICFDLSDSMALSLGDDWISTAVENNLSRLDESKQVFRNVIARIIGYHLASTHVGLVTFSDMATIAAPLSKVRKAFKNSLEDAETLGMTALWDALYKARNMLLQLKRKYPGTKLRVIALTDGEDNVSINDPEEVCRLFYDSNIVLDSIVIGDDLPSELFTISKHTGGYAFQPTSRLLLFQTFLLEPFLDISARPDIVKVPIPDNWDLATPKIPDMQNVYDFPACRPHELQGGDFFPLNSASRFFIKDSGSLLGKSRSASTIPATISVTPMQNLGPVSTRTGRLGVSSGKLYIDEMRLMMAHPHNSMEIYVNESDMTFWKVVMDGPLATPYERGVFVLYVHMTGDFPQVSPVIRFITPILHPNVTKHGRICHGVLSDGWKPSYHIYDVLQHIFGLLTSPETEDAVDELATLKFWTDRETADTEIRKYVEKFATKSRAEWKADILNH